MSDLTPIGAVLARVQAEDVSSDALREAHYEIQALLKRDRDREGAALQFAWLALLAIERIRRMEESHDGSPDRPDGAADDRPHRPGVARRPGGGWFTGASEPATPPVRPR
jgi:hypothetical protein